MPREPRRRSGSAGLRFSAAKARQGFRAQAYCTSHKEACNYPSYIKSIMAVPGRQQARVPPQLRGAPAAATSQNEIVSRDSLPTSIARGNVFNVVGPVRKKHAGLRKSELRSTPASHNTSPSRIQTMDDETLSQVAQCPMWSLAKHQQPSPCAGLLQPHTGQRPDQ